MEGIFHLKVKIFIPGHLSHLPLGLVDAKAMSDGVRIQGVSDEFDFTERHGHVDQGDSCVLVEEITQSVIMSTEHVVRKSAIDESNRNRLNITTIGWSKRDEMLALFDELVRDDYFNKMDAAMVGGDASAHQALLNDARGKRYEELDQELKNFLSGLTKKRKGTSGNRSDTNHSRSDRSNRQRTDGATHRRTQSVSRPQPLDHATDPNAIKASKFGMPLFPQMIQKGISGPLKDVWVCSMCLWTITDTFRAAEHQCAVKNRVSSTTPLYTGRQPRAPRRPSARRRRRRSRSDEAEEDSDEEDEEEVDGDSGDSIEGGVEDLEDTDGESDSHDHRDEDLDGFVVPG